MGEDDDKAPVDIDLVTKTPVPSVCLYLPSREAFRTSFERCREAGILDTGSAATSEAAEASCEFSFRRCLDPDTRGVVLELHHILRCRKHPEWPIPEGSPIQSV